MLPKTRSIRHSIALKDSMLIVCSKSLERYFPYRAYTMNERVRPSSRQVWPTYKAYLRSRQCDGLKNLIYIYLEPYKFINVATIPIQAFIFLFSTVKNIRKIARKLSDTQNIEFGLNDQCT
jgi:hypothetical protein